MGYACPVCDLPQQDGEHLANHLAFTALTNGGDHESWLDEHVPEWSSTGPDELGPRVVEFAEETTFETVFEDTVHDHGHQHGDGHQRGHSPDDGHGGASPFGGDAGTGALDRASVPDAGDDALDADARAVLEEARAMTREMLDDVETGGADDDEDSAEGSADDEATGTDAGSDSTGTDADRDTAGDDADSADPDTEETTDDA